MVNDQIGKRMKRYEYVTRNHLVTRTPVVIRVDGKAFHTFTRGFQRPFDGVLVSAMQATMKYLCENVQGCVLGYTQSDEISLVLVDYRNLDTSPWFDYNIQKCASIAASMATLAFGREFQDCVMDYHSAWIKSCWDTDSDKYARMREYLVAYSKADQRGAMFDARVFNLPKEEVCNYFYWRQLDATRNSIQMVGQAHFSHRELMNKSCNQIQDMLHEQRGINWNDFEDHLKRGSCCIRVASEENPLRSKWTVDQHIPIFKGEGRSYVDDLIVVGG